MGAHLHLLCNHGPLWLELVVLLLLLVDRRELPWRLVLSLIGFSCLLLIFSYLSGGQACEKVAGLPISAEALDRHQQWAIGSVLFGLALNAWAWRTRTSGDSAFVLAGLVALSLLQLGLTCYWGGCIRHTELGPELPSACGSGNCRQP
ncbi:hypothetical protein JST97_02455 [bacterium]|nr:hypothetical protein [bacterium]